MKQIYFILLLVFITYNNLSGQGPDSLKYKSLEPYYFHLQYLINDSALLIDVRESFEFKGKKIKGAINIPASGNFDFVADTLNKNYALFLYCTSGYRSSRVAVKFFDKGFRKLYSLEGGIVAWRKDGFPVAKGNKKKRARERESERAREQEGERAKYWSCSLAVWSPRKAGLRLTVLYLLYFRYFKKPPVPFRRT